MTERPSILQAGAAALAPLQPEDALLLDCLRKVGLHGQSLLVIAGTSARLGLHALAEGAAKVTILAANRLTVEAGSNEAIAAGFQPEFVRGRLDLGALENHHFDTVVCCLPDCLASDPFAWLNAMMARSDRHVLAVVDTPRYGMEYVLARFPLAWVPRPSKPGRRLRRNMLLTPAAIKNILRYANGAFEPATLMPSPVSGRVIVEAHRRTASDMVVVAGPSSSGKSTFAQRLISDARLRSRLGLEGEWHHRRGREVVDLPPGPLGNLIIELDLMAVETGDLAEFNEIPQAQILRCAERLTIFTILPKPPEGYIPMTPAEAIRSVKKCGFLGEALLDFYAGKPGGTSIRGLYQAWLNWVADFQPDEMQFIINDYVDFRKPDPGEIEHILGLS